ncbi:MAG: nodulation protein NfeD [Anaerolineae bacterium]
MDVVVVKGVIDPFTAGYIKRGISTAREDGAQCLVLQLDTPGGLDSAMRAIVQEMMGSPVPIVVYVSPAGARAGSAGAFVTLAAHIAAMAPGTNIGAATPVDLLGGEVPEALRTKVTNDAAAYIKAIAQTRGRNAAWAEEAVRQGSSITAQEAREAGVVDLMAKDLPELLEAIDGWEVSTAWGERVLHTRGASLNRIEMSLPESLLHIIVDPTIAYLLLTLGIWALIAEFYHPGAILPGVTGVICLILAFVAFGSLPINWAGVALIVLAVILFILDIKVAGFALSVGGAVAFVLGSLMLFRPFVPTPPAMPPLSVNPWLIALMTGVFAAFFLFVVSAGLRAQRARVTSGVQALVGARGRATSDLAPLGTVLVRSEDWTAEVVGEPVKAGEEVEVIGVDGVKLRVTKI